MEQDQEMRQSLFQLFHEAGQLSYYLGTQRFDVRVARLDNLRVKEFHHQNQFMEAHSSHQIQLDQDEAALDGQEIYLMLHPAIIAFGTADGSDYHKYTIWKKAVLWMGYSN
ncbi:hypothetical protein BGW36DRAFT_18811 [Talaromyces proteolyticus]|uniref:Uncharacterized protein n=1 Tax=Talaromyces proteolyticus TaxID=1131652 RepID=A0AAD4L4P6_9EURO|nr:uncharacterized protein BGW36DRAFT_18811 [Talaromyces proteolyticus]KAH8705848.1 hypothetical protein BGW36DRAFT_18811 [Talaromyces proteolyticus]